MVVLWLHAMYNSANLTNTFYCVDYKNPNFMIFFFLCKNTHVTCLFSTKAKLLTFLDNRCVGHLASVGGPYADVGDGKFRWGQQGGGAYRRVAEKSWAVTLSAALTPVTVNGCLKLPRWAEPSLFTFIWIEVLHIPGQNRKKTTEMPWKS